MSGHVNPDSKTDLNSTRAGLILERSAEREDADETH